MGERFKKFVEWMNDCKYIPTNSRCAYCGKKMGVFYTGFWSVNVQRLNLQLSDGVLCPSCAQKAESYIKTKKRWLNKELQSEEKWKKFNAPHIILYSADEIKMLMEQKEISDKENIAAYDSNGTGLFEINSSFVLVVNEFTVGISRYKKLNGKTVVFGTAEESTFEKGDKIKLYIKDLVFETTVLEAHRFNKDEAQGRSPDKMFFSTLSANLKTYRKIKENQQGWLILDIDWKHTMDGGRIIKL